MNSPSSTKWVEIRNDAVIENRVQASVLYDGQVVGSLLYSNFPTMVVIYQLQVAAVDDGTDVQAKVIDVLTARFLEDTPPQDFIHVGILDPSTLLTYQRHYLAKGMVVTGSMNGQTYYHDRLVRITAEEIAAASEKGDAAMTGLVLSYAKDLELLDQLETITSDDLMRLLHSPTSSGRIGALREFSRSEALASEERDRAYMYALLDNSYEVRRFASIAMSGFFPGVAYHPDANMLLRHLSEPLQSLEDFDGQLPTMPEGWVYSEPHGRRNKRYGLLWVLGAMFGYSALTEEVQAWRQASRATLEGNLIASMERLTPSRDLELAQIAATELVPGGKKFAIGEEKDLSLGELLRYVVIRHGLVCSAANASEDRFYWLMEMVDYIVPSPLSPRSPRGGEEARQWARKLFAPIPGVAAGSEELPSWLVGRWSESPPMATTPL